MDLVKSAAKVVSARLLGAILSFAGLLYFARAVGPDELGIFFLFQALVGFSAIPANLGTRLAVEKRMSEYGPIEKTRYLSSGLCIKLVLLVPVAGIVLAAEGYLTDYLGADLAVALIIAIALKELADFVVAAIRGELRVGDTAVLDVSYQIGWVSVGVFLTLVGYGLEALVVGLFAGYFLKFAWGLYRLSTPFGRPSVAHARSLISYGIYSVIPSVEGEIHNWMDITLIGVFMSPAAVAAYEVAWRIGNIFLVLIQSIGQTVFPQMSAWDSEDAHDELEALIPQAITPALLLAIPAVGGAWLFSADIIAVLFGSEYIAAAGAFVVIIAAKIPRAIREVVGKALLGIGRADRMTVAALVDIGSNLVLNIVFIQAFGLIGAAFGTAISLTLGTAVRWWYLSRDIRVTIDYRATLWAVGSSVGMITILWPVSMVISTTTAPLLFGLIGVGVVVYVVLVGMNEELRLQVQSALRSVTS